MLDSLTIAHQPEGEEMILDQPAQHYPIRHPYQVLRMLPKDATPAQQDSAIQAVLGGKTEIRYSERPDTLHLPGQPVGKSIKDVSVPQYYNETYFKNDSLFHPEIEAARRGMAGDPVPYSQANDDIIVSILVIFSIFIILGLSHLRNIFAIEVKEFFAPPKDNEIRQSQTTVERLVQVFLALLIPFNMGTLFFNFTTTYISDTFTPSSEYIVLGLFFAATYGTFFGQFLLYRWVNSIFFPDSNLPKWSDHRLFLLALCGALQVPIVLLNVFFNLAISVSLILLGIVYLLYEILIFFKAYYIFFEKNTLKLQIFLYLCTLEIIPIIIEWGILILMADTLTINY